MVRLQQKSWLPASDKEEELERMAGETDWLFRHVWIDPIWFIRHSNSHKLHLGIGLDLGYFSVPSADIFYTEYINID